ncbi:hypothetical protein CANARDRAFT_191805 [[Candida] arabinofermentans NRRL YB-2248]|uniref:BHLH domain-containing protein n=1 Tax=[Candida] arabinofermentans NRRL YB-2248 TaxID=983967 RepID=A0A1E4SYE0_9ASCO|nr:hypothetical protein CANARDRAFT_191805 [[Candida] arabinofermentans NRRL YB-2248]
MIQQPQNSNMFIPSHTGIMNTLPPPPVFKPTFIQMQKSSSSTNLNTSPNLNPNNCISPTITSSNSNYLTSSFMPNDEYNNKLIQHSPSISPMTTSSLNPLTSPSINPMIPPSNTVKRRRKSSTVTNQDEIEKKKKELKTQHSIIEKKRRIRMSREFEALKFIIPACRLNILNGFNENNFDNSNLMHKLTILQSTVEYIKYLHLVIKLLKLQMLTPIQTRSFFIDWLNLNNNLNFIEFDLDLQNYRDIDKSFNFDELFLKIWKNNGEMNKDEMDPISKEIESLMSSMTNDSSQGENNLESEDDFDDEDEDEDDNNEEDNEPPFKKQHIDHQQYSKSNNNDIPTPLITPELSHNIAASLSTTSNTPGSHINANRQTFPLSIRHHSLSSSSSSSNSSIGFQEQQKQSSIDSQQQQQKTAYSDNFKAKFKLPLPAIQDTNTNKSTSDSMSIENSELESASDSISRSRSSSNSPNYETKLVGSSSAVPFTTPMNAILNGVGGSSTVMGTIKETGSLAIGIGLDSGTGAKSGTNSGSGGIAATISSASSISRSLPNDETSSSINNDNDGDDDDDSGSGKVSVSAASKVLLLLKGTERRTSIESLLN